MEYIDQLLGLVLLLHFTTKAGLISYSKLVHSTSFILFSLIFKVLSDVFVSLKIRLSSNLLFQSSYLLHWYSNISYLSLSLQL
jgi:hypothetical protein